MSERALEGSIIWMLCFSRAVGAMVMCYYWYKIYRLMIAVTKRWIICWHKDGVKMSRPKSIDSVQET